MPALSKNVFQLDLKRKQGLAGSYVACLCVCCSPETLPLQAHLNPWTDFSPTWTHREMSGVLDFYEFHENCHLVWEKRLRLVASVWERRVVLGSFWHAVPWISSQSPATHPRNFGWRIWICISKPVSVQTASFLKGIWKEIGGNLSGTICSARWGSRRDDSGTCSENSRLSSVTAAVCPSSRVMSPWLFRESLVFHLWYRIVLYFSSALQWQSFLIWQILKQI